MVKRHDKGSDGMYHIGSHKYAMLEGSRAQVWHGTAYKTAGAVSYTHLTLPTSDLV